MGRIEEIEIEMNKLNKILESKDKSWDFTREPYREVYKEYSEFTSLERTQLNELDREMRLIMNYVLSDLPNYGTVMSLEHFIECVNDGGFMDYDGYGHYIKDGKESNIEIWPSDVKHNSVRKDFDTIIWFNR